jgi:hypothetical protein
VFRVRALFLRVLSRVIEEETNERWCIEVLDLDLRAPEWVLGGVFLVKRITFLVVQIPIECSNAVGGNRPSMIA